MLRTDAWSRGQPGRAGQGIILVSFNRRAACLVPVGVTMTHSRLRLARRRHAVAALLFVVCSSVCANPINRETSPRTFPLRLELAQFAFDTEQFDKAVGYFEKAFPVGEKMPSQKQPTAMAQLLGDYAMALERSGKAAKAQSARIRAASLLEKGGEATVLKRDYVPYPEACN